MSPACCVRGVRQHAGWPVPPRDLRLRALGLLTGSMRESTDPGASARPGESLTGDRRVRQVPDHDASPPPARPSSARPRPSGSCTGAGWSSTPLALACDCPGADAATEQGPFRRDRGSTAGACGWTVGYAWNAPATTAPGVQGAVPATMPWIWPPRRYRAPLRRCALCRAAGARGRPDDDPAATEQTPASPPPLRSTSGLGTVVGVAAPVVQNDPLEHGFREEHSAVRRQGRAEPSRLDAPA